MKNVPILLSEISLVPIKPKDGLLGFASLVLNGQFYVGEIAIRSRPQGGIRLLYPTKKLLNGREVAVFHPISKNSGEQVQEAVAEQWEVLMHLKGNA